MDKINPPQELNFRRNIGEYCKLWKQELQLYITATETLMK